MTIGGRKSARSGSGRPPVGGWPAPGRAAETALTPSAATPCGDEDATDAPRNRTLRKLNGSDPVVPAGSRLIAMPCKGGKGTLQGPQSRTRASTIPRARRVGSRPGEPSGPTSPASPAGRRRRPTPTTRSSNRERQLAGRSAPGPASAGLIRPQEITKPILERYQRHLFLHRKKDGEPLSTRTQIAPHRVPVQGASSSGSRSENYVLYNPASELDLAPHRPAPAPQHPDRRPRPSRCWPCPNLKTADRHPRPGDARDALLHGRAPPGADRPEALRPRCRARGVIMVRQGKGNKDRMIPIGARALAWVDKYLEDVRPELTSGADDGTLFLAVTGQPFSSARLAEIVREAVNDSGIGKRGACHMFRHTMATLMLENGADIRFIQAMLGHAELSTTEIYTQVSIKQLKAVHTATHPARPLGEADNLRRRRRSRRPRPPRRAWSKEADEEGIEA